MSNPITGRRELSRLPLQRRPVADPGTTLVFLSRRGDLVGGEHALTSGEVWWRAFRAVYTVDTRPHGASFTCQLPTMGDALHFDASVTYNWSVHDAATVVRDEVTDGAGSCREYLIKRMREICRRVDPAGGRPAEQAERLIHADLGQTALRLGNGLAVTALHVAITLDAEQLAIARDLAIGPMALQRDVMNARGQNEVESIRQSGEFDRRRERIEFYAPMVGGNTLVASILAEDPTKATETMQLLATTEQQKRAEAIKAMQVIIEGGHLQIGDLDPAISAVVSQFTSLLSSVNTAIGGAPAEISADESGPAS